MGTLTAINRSLLGAAVLVACAAPSWGEASEDLRMSPRAPRFSRASCQEAHEASRAVPRLQPAFPHFWAAILDDVKELEQRPEGTSGEWAEPIRHWLEIAGDCRPPVAAPTFEQRQAWERLSGDERARRGGGMQRRLFNLAITGRITKVEFDRLLNRLHGN